MACGCGLSELRTTAFVIDGKPMPVWKSILFNWIANNETCRA